MAKANYQINERFDTASNGLTPEQRACHVIAAFTTGTMGRAFNAHGFWAELSRREDLGLYMMEMKLLPDSSEQDGINFLHLAESILEKINAIRQDSPHEPFGMDAGSLNQGSAQESFVMITPDLKDFTALYAHISERHTLRWNDAKYCAKIGREYSLADLEQVIALVPESDNEDVLVEMDRPLDLGLPKARLQ